MKQQDSATAPTAIALHPAGTGPEVPTGAGAELPARPAASGFLLAGLAVAIFSLTFPTTQWALRGFGPWSVVGLRDTMAAVLAGTCLLVSRARLPARRYWPGLLTVGLGCVVGYPVLTTLALQSSTTAHSAVVVGLLPLSTAVFGALRAHRRPSRRFWTAAGAGAAVVVAFTLTAHHGRPTTADLYLFAALVLCAAGYAEGGRLAQELPGWQVIAWAVVLVLPVTALITALALPREPVHLGAHALGGVLFLAVSQVVSYIPWYRGMALIGVPRASQVQLAQPLLTLAWAALLLGEPVPASAPLAAVLVLGCIAATQQRI